MELIECPSCHKKVSTISPSCPNCDYWEKAAAIEMAVAIVIIFIGVAFLFFSFLLAG